MAMHLPQLAAHKRVTSGWDALCSIIILLSLTLRQILTLSTAQPSQTPFTCSLIAFEGCQTSTCWHYTRNTTHARSSLQGITQRISYTFRRHDVICLTGVKPRTPSLTSVPATLMKSLSCGGAPTPPYLKNMKIKIPIPPVTYSLLRARQLCRRTACSASPVPQPPDGALRSGQTPMVRGVCQPLETQRSGDVHGFPSCGANAP